MCVNTPALAAPYQLGDTTIDLSISVRSGNYIYIHIHENERTALQAAKRYLSQHAGKLITLSHSGNRLIRFTLNGQRYQFDPNRIFTKHGLRKTLNANSGHVTPEAIAVVSDFADKITDMLGSQSIVALHNNANETIKSYLPGGKFARAAAKTAYFPKQNPHNFFLVTQSNRFESLKQQGYNVVLQNNSQVPDDGSLSVYAAKHGIPYTNVEAGYNALAAQIAMLNALN
jgi:hypothetical protein